MSETGTTVGRAPAPRLKIGCGGLSHASDAGPPACQRGDWAGLVVRRTGWPQNELVEEARKQGWGVLNVPLGAPSVGWMDRRRATQLAGRQIDLPDRALIRYFGATSLELHYRIENAHAPIGDSCARFGLDLVGLDWTLAYSPADKPGNIVDLERDRRRIAEAHGELIATAFEDFNRNEHGKSKYNAPLQAKILRSTLLGDLPDRGSVPTCRPLVGTGIPDALRYPAPQLVLDYEIGSMSDGRGRRLYSEASPGGPDLQTWYAQTRGGAQGSEVTGQHEPNPPEKTRLFGVGCDLYFFVDKHGIVLDPKTGQHVFVPHPFSRGPHAGMALVVPLMYYNVRFAAEFRLQAFVVQASGEYCISDPFAVHVRYRTAASKAPVLEIPSSAEEPPKQVIGADAPDGSQPLRRQAVSGTAYPRHDRKARSRKRPARVSRLGAPDVWRAARSRRVLAEHAVWRRGRPLGWAVLRHR